MTGRLHFCHLANCERKAEVTRDGDFHIAAVDQLEAWERDRRTDCRRERDAAS